MLPRLGSSFWDSFLKAKQQILISLSQPAISPSLPNKTTKADSPSPYADDIAADSITGFVKTEIELLLLLIKENISFNSSHSWLGHMQPSRKHQPFKRIH